MNTPLEVLPRTSPGTTRSNASIWKSIDGFSGKFEPVSREAWRTSSGIDDPNRQLIPMNFFLYSTRGVEDDFLLVDQFVEVALDQPYGREFSSSRYLHSMWRIRAIGEIRRGRIGPVCWVGE